MVRSVLPESITNSSQFNPLKLAIQSGKLCSSLSVRITTERRDWWDRTRLDPSSTSRLAILSSLAIDACIRGCLGDNLLVQSDELIADSFHGKTSGELLPVLSCLGPKRWIYDHPLQRMDQFTL